MPCADAISNTHGQLELFIQVGLTALYARVLLDLRSSVVCLSSHHQFDVNGSRSGQRPRRASAPRNRSWDSGRRLIPHVPDETVQSRITRKFFATRPKAKFFLLGINFLVLILT